MKTHLKAEVNSEGFIGIKGRFRNATKKQAAAPNKHAPNPNNLGVILQYFAEYVDFEYSPLPLRQCKVCFLLITPFAATQWDI